MEIRVYESGDQSQVIDLWQRAGLTRPWNDPAKDIQRKLALQAEWFLVGVLDGQVVATIMAGYDGHRGWINYLAVDPIHQRRGFGRAMMRQAEQMLLLAGCPKINLQVRQENAGAIEFYRRIGFRDDAVVSFGKRLIVDETLFKVLHQSQWDDAKRAGLFSGCGIDLADGFIHLSSPSQIVETVRRYFSGHSDLLLLSIDASQLGDSLRWEASRGGDLFPHVYGDIPLAAVVSVATLPLDDEGSHVFPSSLH